MKAGASWGIQDGEHDHAHTYTHGGSWVAALTFSLDIFHAEVTCVSGRTGPLPMVDPHATNDHAHLPLAEVLQILPGSVEVVPSRAQGSQSHLHDR